MTMELLFPKYEDIKTMYGWGCYTNDQIKWFVDMEVIDKEEYALITGEKYPEESQEVVVCQEKKAKMSYQRRKKSL